MTQPWTSVIAGLVGGRTRTPSKAETLTGVGALLEAQHRSRSGDVHGHTWDIMAWFSFDGHDALGARRELEQILAPHQGKCLPDAIAWAENLAPWIAGQFEYRQPVCVTVARPDVRLFAQWRAA